MATVGELLPKGVLDQYPPETLTPAARRALAMPVPAGLPPEALAQVSQIVTNGLPRQTTAYATIQASRGRAAAREAAIPEVGSDESIRATFNQMPAWARYLQQFETPFQELMTQKKAEVPAPQGFGEKAARIAGGAAEFGTVATPLTLALAPVAGPAAPFVAAGLAGAAEPGTLKERASRGAAMTVGALVGSGIGHAVAKTVAQRMAAEAPEVAAAIGREHVVTVEKLIGQGLKRPEAEKAANKLVMSKIEQVVSTANRNRGIAVGAGEVAGNVVGFGGAAPLTEAKLEGKPLPKPSDYLAGGAQMLALELLLRGARGELRPPGPGGGGGAPDATVTARRIATTRQPGPGETPTPGPPEAGAPSIATPAQRTFEPAAAAVEKEIAHLPDAGPSAALGGLTPRAAARQLALSRVDPNDAETAGVAARWAAENVQGAVAIRDNLTPSRGPMDAVEHRSSERATQMLAATLEQVSNRPDVRLVVPGGTLRNVGFNPALMRVYPWEQNQVRLTVVDQSTGQMHPVAFKSVADLEKAIQAGPEAPTLGAQAREAQIAELRSRATAIEQQAGKGGPKSARRTRRAERLHAQIEELGADTQRAEETKAGLVQRVTALEKQIKERPTDARVGTWRRRLAAARGQLLGLGGPARHAEAPTGKEVSGRPAEPAPTVEVKPAPAPEIVKPVQPPVVSPVPAPAASTPRPPAAPVAAPKAAPPAKATEAAPERVIAPDLMFSKEADAHRVRDRIEQGIPGSDPVVVQTRKGWGIEVNAAPAVSRLKKIPAPVTEPSRAPEAFKEKLTPTQRTDLEASEERLAAQLAKTKASVPKPPPEEPPAAALVAAPKPESPKPPRKTHEEHSAARAEQGRKANEPKNRERLQRASFARLNAQNEYSAEPTPVNEARLRSAIDEANAAHEALHGGPPENPWTFEPAVGNVTAAGARGLKTGERVTVPYLGTSKTRTFERGVVQGYIQHEGAPHVVVHVSKGKTSQVRTVPEQHVRRRVRSITVVDREKAQAATAKIEKKLGKESDLKEQYARANELLEKAEEAFRIADQKAHDTYPQVGEEPSKEYEAARRRAVALRVEIDSLKGTLRKLEQLDPDYKDPWSDQGGFVRLNPLGFLWDLVAGREEPETEGDIETLLPGSADPELSTRIVDALAEAKPLRTAQERMYTAERAERHIEYTKRRKINRGRAGFHKALGALHGPLEQLDFEPLEDTLSAADQDAAFEAVNDTNRLGRWEKVSAQRGLEKLMNGRIPQDAEIAKLAEVFGERFVHAVVGKQDAPLANRIGRAMGITKSLRATADISLTYRQGWLLQSRPGYLRVIRRQFRAMRTVRGYNRQMKAIYEDKHYALSRRGGLAITKPSSLLTEREEQFASDFAERMHEPLEQMGPAGEVLAKPVKLASRGIAASNRAASAAGNYFRYWLVFRPLVDLAELMGRDIENDRSLVRDICKFANDASGRGDLGRFAKSADVLNEAFWSPRFVASRLHMMSIPYYMKLDPLVRDFALKTVLSSAAIAATMASIIALATGTVISLALRDPDFGKIKIGDTRFDLGGGFLQYIRLGANLIYDFKHRGEKGFRKSASDDLLHFAQGKLGPVGAFIADWLAGKDYNGQPFKLSEEAKKLFVPMAWQDTAEAAYTWGWNSPMTWAVFGAATVGAGTQTYPQKMPKSMKPTHTKEDAE